MTGMSSFSSCLIMRVASKPSIIGILKSIKIKSNLPGNILRSKSTASFPFPALAGQQSSDLRIRRNNLTSTLVSSTSMTDILPIPSKSADNFAFFLAGTLFTLSSRLFLYVCLLPAVFSGEGDKVSWIFKVCDDWPRLVWSFFTSFMVLRNVVVIPPFWRSSLSCCVLIGFV